MARNKCNGMRTLIHHPLCPHSRFVRLALSEYGLPVRLAVERVWERREDFLLLNPAGTTPVLVVEGIGPAPGLRLSPNTLTRFTAGNLAIVDFSRAPLTSGSRCADWLVGSTTSSLPM